MLLQLLLEPQLASTLLAAMDSITSMMAATLPVGASLLLVCQHKHTKKQPLHLHGHLLSSGWSSTVLSSTILPFDGS
eukprot:2952546-Ditylum_brightwellii.AAC.2